MNRRGFTLIELLVVIAIIAILAGIMMPSLERAREKAALVACMSNLHSITMAMTMYCGDFSEHFPTDSPMGDPIPPESGWVYPDYLAGGANGPAYSSYPENMGELHGRNPTTLLEAGEISLNPAWTGQESSFPYSCMGQWCNKLYDYARAGPLYTCDRWERTTVPFKMSFNGSKTGLSDYDNMRIGAVDCDYAWNDEIHVDGRFFYLRTTQLDASSAPLGHIILLGHADFPSLPSPYFNAADHVDWDFQDDAHYPHLWDFDETDPMVGRDAENPFVMGNLSVRVLTPAELIEDYNGDQHFFPGDVE